MNMNWLPLKGNPQIEKNEIKFFPAKDKEGNALPRDDQKLNQVKSSILFGEGTIDFKVYLKDPKDKVQLLLGADTNGVINIGLNSRDWAYGIAKKTNGKYDHLDNNGFEVDLPIEQWINVKVKCVGSNIELLINDVVVCKAYSSFHNSQLELLCRSIEEVQIKDFKLDVQLPKAFVVMQFSEEFNVMYTEIIKPICEQYGYDVVRADDMYTNTMLIEDITLAIKESSLIIADITPDNPNVYYEVGYAHALNKPTIMLCDRQRAKLPFDISGMRTVFYDNSIAGKNKVESLLIKHLSAL